MFLDNNLSENQLSKVQDFILSGAIFIGASKFLSTFARFAERVFQADGGSKEELASAGIEKLRGFFASLGAPVRMRDLGVPEEALPDLAAGVTRDGPVGALKKLQAKDVLAIMQTAY